MNPRYSRRSDIEAIQLDLLNSLLDKILPANRFYQTKYAGKKYGAFSDLEQFRQTIPFSRKEEVVQDQLSHPPHGTNLTYPLSRYIHFSQTSGTSGAPLRWLDTPESWQWMLQSWKRVFQNCGVTAADHIGFAFSFGPFLGFWTAFDAARQMGCLCIPTGGLSSVARLHVFMDNPTTVLCCTPTYAIRLGEVAREQGIDLATGKVKRLVVAGEPGGSLPETVRLIESLWPGAKVYDHHGMTEVGPVSYRCPDNPGLLRIMEDAYLAEIVDPAGSVVQPGEVGELVLTTLGRIGMPLVRYRTGDLVRRVLLPADRNAEMALEGGILGRVDDMISVRGVNVFPAAIEKIIRAFPEVLEYRVEIRSLRGMDEMAMIVEITPGAANPDSVCARIGTELQSQLALRVPVSHVQKGELPRFEMKAKRWIRIDN